MTYSAEQRATAIETVIAGLSKGMPLTVLCSADGMPNDDTVRDWAAADEELLRAIARARDRGFDAIAMEALRIADTQAPGEIRTIKADGTIETKEEDMLGHRKLQIETRLKLLAKWDPKRYGDKQLVGSDPDNPLPAGTSVIAVGATMEEAAEAYRRLVQGV